MRSSDRLSIAGLRFVGSSLVRPECVLAHRSGLLFAADWAGAGGVAVIRADGAVRRIEAHGLREPLRPNGIALEANGSFLIAHLGADTGGVFRMWPNGAVSPVLVALDGQPLPPTNFATRDADDRLWITVSTRKVPRDLGYRPDADDGFIVCRFPDGRAAIVADGLGYANECALAADGAHLYVNETFGRRLSRFAVRGDGTLGDRETVAAFGPGTFPDGLAFDAEGQLWITSIVSNRVIRVDPASGRQTMILEDTDPDHLAEVEAAFQAGRLGRPHLDTVKSRRLASISSLAFGGPDLETAYLGCLLGGAIAAFDAPVAGARPRHWTANVDACLSLFDAPPPPEGHA